MSGQKLERIRTTLADFIGSYVRLGDELSIISYADDFEIFGPREMQNQNDAEDATEFIEALTAGGAANFCEAFTEAGNPAIFHDLRSVVVISDGQFTGCGTTQATINANLLALLTDVQNNNPNVTLYSVGIFPEVEDTLRYLGQIGGGGYVRWS
jgi:Mg-chelatase subunit ChlD